MKNKDLIKPIEFVESSGSQVNESIKNMTVGELMNSADETIIKGNTINIIKIDNDKTMNLKITLYSDGKKMDGTEIRNRDSNKELVETIKEMQLEGMTQKEIAIKTGISQSYVSQLLKDR